jgi:hypothetical protein
VTALTTNRVRGDAARSTRVLGLLCLWAGGLGVASGIFLAVVPPVVDDDRYSYPLTAAGFVLIQGWFVLQHLGLVAGLVGLGRSAAVGARRVGVGAAIAGMGLLTATELAAIGAARSTYPGPGTGLLDALYGISSVVIGLGLVAAGVAVLQEHVWRGWRRWLPLALGVYVFVPMFPAMFGGFLAARLAITGWMLLFALLGWALGREDSP